MPTTIVVDTSVLIDLDRGGLTEAALALPFEFVVPRLLLEEELRPDKAAHLTSSGLRAVELDGDAVAQAGEYRRRTGAISAVDAFVLVLAKTSGLMLLTGDGPLRRLATDDGVETHGLFWLFDRFEEAGTLDPAALHASLTAIAGHNRCRLPGEQVRLRLARYSGPAAETT